MQSDQMNTELLEGSCHCGTVKFEVRAAIAPAIRCNCSLCRRKGILMSPLFVKGDLKILSGEDAVGTYQFNTYVAKHYFCKHCGIHPFVQTIRGPDSWRVNVGCLEGVDPYALMASLVDGASLPVVERP
jgi:hypothetical protein